MSRRAALRLASAILILFISLLIAGGSPGSLPAVTADDAGAPPPIRGTYRVAVIPIEGTIDGILESTVRRRAQAALESDPDAIVIAINTWGGEIDAAVTIADYLFTIGNGRAQRPRVVALGETKVISAGALLALSCEEIWLRPNAIIGDVAPVTYEDGTPQILGEKIQTVVRQALATYAERNGYPIPLMEAMVTPAWTVYRVTHIDGSVEFVRGQDFDRWTEAQRATVASQDLVDGPDTILTLSPVDAVSYGLARGMVDGRDALYTALAEGAPVAVDTYDLTWWEILVTFLNTPVCRLILLGVGVLGAWVEIKAPGFGVPGTLSILAFGLFFFGGYLAGLTNVAEIIMFVLGLALLLFELLTPGFGIVGISGIFLMLASLVLSMQTFFIPTTRDEVVTLSFNVCVTFGGLAVAGFAMLGLLRILPESRLLSHLIHTSTLGQTTVKRAGAEEGPAAGVGAVGTAVTPLRPSGRVEIAGKPFDALADGTFVDAGSRVRVVRMDGAQVVVERVVEGGAGMAGA